MQFTWCFVLYGQNQNRHMHAEFRSCVPQDIAAEFWVGAQRSRKQRLITVGKHQVLRENNYDLASVRILSLLPAPALFADSSSCGVLLAASRCVAQHGQSGQAACVLVRPPVGNQHLREHVDRAERHCVLCRGSPACSTRRRRAPAWRSLSAAAPAARSRVPTTNTLRPARCSL